jgi:hypothetical protein
VSEVISLPVSIKIFDTSFLLAAKLCTPFSISDKLDGQEQKRSIIITFILIRDFQNSAAILIMMKYFLQYFHFSKVVLFHVLGIQAMFMDI